MLQQLVVGIIVKRQNVKVYIDKVNIKSNTVSGSIRFPASLRQRKFQQMEVGTIGECQHVKVHKDESKSAQ